MSVQRNSRLEIRINDDLKSKVKNYCNSKGIDISDLVRSLLIRHIKYKPEKELKYWIGSIEDIPL